MSCDWTRMGLSERHRHGGGRCYVAGGVRLGMGESMEAARS